MTGRIGLPSSQMHVPSILISEPLGLLADPIAISRAFGAGTCEASIVTVSAPTSVAHNPATIIAITPRNHTVDIHFLVFEALLRFEFQAHPLHVRAQLFRVGVSDIF